MKIGIIGSGMVGQTLANGFIKHNYEVMIGSRDINKLKEWKETSSYKGQIGNFSEAAAFGDIIVLAAKGNAAEQALNLSGSANLRGKIIMDATNPIDESQPPVNGVLKFFTSQNSSLMERLQALFPEANFVKAFSSVGASLMVNPDFGGIKPSMFICGNNENAKNEVSKILVQFGWDVEDMGMANAAGTIESLCILWCIPGMLRNEWTGRAFKMLRK
jgi:8-hydroxy-5-deazaflavin:NADPH oxidoreductase